MHVCHRYWNSENNLIDGPMYNNGKFETGLHWLESILGNIVTANATSTIECPLFHGWTQNLARHNHGSSYFNDPWSGFYELSAPFWMQAHVSQLTEIGWEALPVGAGSGTARCGGSDSGFYVTFVSPDRSDFSIVLVNGDDAPCGNLTVRLTGARDQPLYLWQSSSDEWFRPGAPVALRDGVFTTSVAASSAYTWTTISDASHTDYPIPPRTQFPLPFTATFDEQDPPSPGRYFSDAWGSFEVHKDASTGNNVLRASAPYPPVGWNYARQLDPFTLLPSGTNWLSYNISVMATLREANTSGTPYVSLCGRIPIWPLRKEGLAMSPPMGVCLVVNRTHWALDSRDDKSQRVLASGVIPVYTGGNAKGRGRNGNDVLQQHHHDRDRDRRQHPQQLHEKEENFTSEWVAMSLEFDEYSVKSSVNGVEAMGSPFFIENLTGGVVGLGCGSVETKL